MCVCQQLLIRGQILWAWGMCNFSCCWNETIHGEWIKKKKILHTNLHLFRIDTHTAHKQIDINKIKKCTLKMNKIAKQKNIIRAKMEVNQMRVK